MTIYQQLTGRTLLLHPSLPTIAFTINAPANNAAEAARVMQKEFAERKIMTIPDGDKFLVVVPEGQAASVQPRSKDLKPAAITNAAPVSGDPELVPAGVINFQAVDLVVVAMIYAELRGGKLDRSEPFAGRGTIILKTQTPLSREEVIYVLDTLFSWHGLKAKMGEDKSIKFISIASPDR